jgi:SAM-dependent methyltransferase
MREELTEILAEPGTQAPLELTISRGSAGVIEEGTLTSTATGKPYPIRGGIPRFVEADSYAESFGRQWNRFREVQLDSHNGASYSRTRFDAEIGWTTEQLSGRWVLDAGCGAGRFAEIAAGRGAKLVALDISTAVEAAARTLSSFKNASVVQGSILEPPFREGSFDYCYSIGVMQHTPEPPQGIASVVRCVREGGAFALTAYARRPWTKLYSKYLLRPVTVRLPPERLLATIEKMMPVAFPVTDVLFRIPWLGKVAKFALPVANYVDRSDLTREQRYHEAVLDTFDMLSPTYDSPLTWQEVEAAIQNAGASTWQFRSRVPINLLGTR